MNVTLNHKNKAMREFEIKSYIRTIMNGGVGSGNFNPGQGRGVGKPNSKISFSENVKKKTNDYLDKAITVEEDEILNEQYLVSNLRVFGDNPSYEFLKENNVSEETIDKCKELLKKHVGQEDYQKSGDNEILENIKNNTEVGKAFKLNAQYQKFLAKEIENRVSKLEKEARENENADYSRLNVRTAKDGTLVLYRIGKVGNKDIESYAYSEDSSFLEGGGYSRYSRKDVENNGYEIFAGLCDGFYKDSAQQFNTYGEYEVVTIKKDLLK